MRKYLPVVVFISAIFLRFSRLSELMYFMIDEDRYSFVMKRIFVDHKLILAGVTIPGGIYLGPAYFYVSGLLQLLFGFNPILMGAVASAVGAISVMGVYWLGKKFFGFTTGIIAATFYTFSYIIVIYSRIYWTLTWSSLAALTTYWGIYQIIRQQKFAYMYLMTGWFILGSQSDASYFSLIVLAIIMLWRLKKHLLIPIALLITAQLPLLAFDLRHDFHNTQLILQRLTTLSSVGTPSIHNTVKALMIFPKGVADLLVVYPPYDITYRLSPAEAAKSLRESRRSTPVIILASLMLVVFLLYRHKGQTALPATIIKTHLQIAIVGVLLYSFVFPGYVHTWFLTILFPAFALMIGWLLQFLINHGWQYMVAVIMVLFSISHTYFLINTKNPFGFKYKQQAVQYAITQMQGKKFFLNSLGSQAYGGYRYLFWLYDHEPVRSYMDNFYSGWIYETPSEIPAEVGVVMVNISPFEPESKDSTQQINQARSQAIHKQTFGGIEILVVPAKEVLK